MERRTPHTERDLIDTDLAFDAFSRRDRSQDGRFFVAVRTTGIYCKPSCPARRPRRKNIEFFETAEAARAAGYRSCKRCIPDEAGRDRVAVERAVAMIEASGERLPLEHLAVAVGYAPHHFQKIFKRALGVSPAAYGRALRGRRLERALIGEDKVTYAIYDAGYESVANAYADAPARLGMSPGTRKRGGAGERIRHAVVPTSLGSMLVAATDRGLCRISFDENEDDLRALLPGAEFIPCDAAFEALVRDVVASVDDPARCSDHLPIDVRGTAFQEAVWAALRAIPPGETRTYTEIAAAAGKPSAVRAAGTACGDNRLAVVIPCHRVLRGDGSLGGYHWGLTRKRALIGWETGRLSGARS